MKIKTDIKRQKHTVLEKEIQHKVEQVIYKPDKQTHNNEESEMQSYAVIIKHNYITDCSIVWDLCKLPLYRHARTYIHTKQKPLNVVVGCEFTTFKPKPIGDMNMSLLNDDEEANEGYRGNYMSKALLVSTKHISVYTPESMKETILRLEDELDKNITQAIEDAAGSGWGLYQFNKCIF